MTLNPKEAPNGYRAAQSGGKGYCAMCAYRGKADCYRTDCAPAYRRDGCNVHFVKQPKPKKTAKTRRYVTRWIVASEVLLGDKWEGGQVIWRSRSQARMVSNELKKMRRCYRNVMPPQAVKVRIF